MASPRNSSRPKPGRHVSWRVRAGLGGARVLARREKVRELTWFQLRGRGGVRGPRALTHTAGCHPQIWYLLEGSHRVYKLFPSEGWEVYVSLQRMHQSSLHAPNETMVTLFYEDSKLYQVLGGGRGETPGGGAAGS